MRSPACSHCIDHGGRQRLHLQHIHAIDRLRGQSIRGRFAANVGDGLRAFERRAHGVSIVFADEQHRQLPERGQIQRLMKFAFGNGSLTEEAGGYG